MTRRAARVDANHAEISKTFERLGCEVFDASGVGGGFSDLVVHQRAKRRLMLVEVKDGKKSPSKQRLTPDQVAFHARFPVEVVNSIEQVIELLGEG